jgi:hypothetical protein
MASPLANHNEVLSCVFSSTVFEKQTFNEDEKAKERESYLTKYLFFDEALRVYLTQPIFPFLFETSDRHAVQYTLTPKHLRKGIGLTTLIRFFKKKDLFGFVGLQLNKTIIQS